MGNFRKKVYAAAGYNTIYFGYGRKEFDPTKPMRPFEEYLKETASGTRSQIPNVDIDEGIIGSFMSSRFIKQGNLPGFLPFMMPELLNKPCTAVEGACGTGARAIAMGVRSILSEISDSVFVAGFEMQNRVKSVYGADILAGAGYYAKERKSGHAFFFPGVFAERTKAYYNAYGEATCREAMAKWYEQAILNARKNSKAQEFHNSTHDLFKKAMELPNPKHFIPFLNQFNCSKITDGASSLILFSEEGIKRCGIDKKNALEIIAIGEAQADLTSPPKSLTALSTTEVAIAKALSAAEIKKEDLGLLEIHDCFSITALLTFEALGLAEVGKSAEYILAGHASKDGKLPTNLSGGLAGFGHPTGLQE